MQNTKTVDERIADAQYDYAQAFVRHLSASAADPAYRQAFLAVYAETVSADAIPAIEAAIAEILEHAALNDDEPAGSVAA